MNQPRFYRWGGGGVRHTWSFGYLTGKDNDLVCITPNILDKMEAEMVLSPVCVTRPLAISAFVLKKALLRLDGNMGVRRYSCGNPNK